MNIDYESKMPEPQNNSVIMVESLLYVEHPDK
jgi:hypothetical protein